MKSTFRHAYFPQNNDLQKSHWDRCLFSFDTSVLLNVYGYSSETREAFLKLLEKLQTRICLPYQFGLEFSENRPKTIWKQVNMCSKAEGELKNLKNAFISKKENPFVKETSLNSISEIISELAEVRENLTKLIKNDPFADRILNVFEGKLGDKPTIEDLTKMHIEAKVRYTNSIPPGYKDQKEKEEPRSFGDYIAWKQLIEMSKKYKKDLILVCDDQKEDWYNYVGEKGFLVGPRPELLIEFKKETEQEILIFTSFNFLHYANEFLDDKIPEHTLAEVKDFLSNQQNMNSDLNKNDIKSTFMEDDLEISKKADYSLPTNKNIDKQESSVVFEDDDIKSEDVPKKELI